MKNYPVFVLLLPTLCYQCIQGLPNPSERVPSEYYSDDYYSSDDDYLNEHEKVVHTTPSFVSTSTNQLVNEGDTIKLPCLVDKLDGFVVLWKKGKDIVAVGSQLFNKDDTRVKVEGSDKGSTLVISLAEASDAGEYKCQISSPKPTELRHSIRIRVAPEIRSVPSNGHLVVYQGDPATLGCDILKGSPTPDITWKRKERKMPSGEDEIRGLSITFTSATRHHSGIYTCIADNGFGRSANATIILDVQHAPVVEQEQTFIHTRETEETEVICTVHASPKAEVVWFKNGVQLTQRQGIFSQRGNRHSLILPGIRESTYGSYKCKATNKFGSDERTTEVSGKAGPVNFKSDPYGTEENSHNLEWVAESITKISNFKLQYRVDKDVYYTDNEISGEAAEDDKSWIEVQVDPHENGDHFFSGKFAMQNLKSAHWYQARVASKNDYGYSEFSKPFRFSTRGADSTLQRTDNHINDSGNNNERVPVQQPSTGGCSPISRVSVGFLILSLAFVSIWQ